MLQCGALRRELLGCGTRGATQRGGETARTPPQPRPHRAAPHAVPVPGCAALTVAPRTRAVPARGGGMRGRGGATAGELRCCRCCRCGSAQGAAPGARPGPARLPALRRAAGCQGHRYRHRHPRYRQAGGETAGRPPGGAGARQGDLPPLPPSKVRPLEQGQHRGGGTDGDPQIGRDVNGHPRGIPRRVHIPARLHSSTHACTAPHTRMHPSEPRVHPRSAQSPPSLPHPQHQGQGKGSTGRGGGGFYGRGTWAAALGTQCTHTGVTKPDPNSFIL